MRVKSPMSRLARPRHSLRYLDAGFAISPIHLSLWLAAQGVGDIATGISEGIEITDIFAVDLADARVHLPTVNQDFACILR